MKFLLAPFLTASASLPVLALPVLRALPVLALLALALPLAAGSATSTPATGTDSHSDTEYRQLELTFANCSQGAVELDYIYRWARRLDVAECRGRHDQEDRSDGRSVPAL